MEPRRLRRRMLAPTVPVQAQWAQQSGTMSRSLGFTLENGGGRPVDRGGEP